ncbi:MAG: IPTL-CTERM sorting domain-containing protein [Candidatus Dadabacteria bacterium]|nr:IPTL-CTERM sorting domain-containing protein [Candidatus Dadabacteria bacterium]
MHQTGNVFFSTDFADLDSITTSGVQQDIGDLDHETKGLAFDCVVPPPGFFAREIPTLSEWGLIAMAGVLGIVGFMVIRRRKVTA